VFAFVRSPDGLGCPADHSRERFLIVVNKAQRSKEIQLSMAETALSGCTEFSAAQPGAVVAPEMVSGNLQVGEPAESFTVYRVK
jgi:hypothetical protein